MLILHLYLSLSCLSLLHDLSHMHTQMEEPIIEAILLLLLPHKGEDGWWSPGFGGLWLVWICRRSSPSSSLGRPPGSSTRSPMTSKVQRIPRSAAAWPADSPVACFFSSSHGASYAHPASLDGVISRRLEIRFGTEQYIMKTPTCRNWSTVLQDIILCIPIGLVWNQIHADASAFNIRLFAHQKIQLKLGVPIMLLRTIYQSMGLCNGTHLIVTQLGDWVPEAEIRTGSHIRQHTCIPHIVLNICSCFKVDFYFAMLAVSNTS
ncbi:uncharacterized protein LOC124706604 [Lolium rigidum]|uniref:uncharacterized protein LOC124706604 n=1 Tax=Lolium rigidum TaxID=89674 RepID=UPI001F5DF53F|nr:uncharacterized protein LOC124706604 [Lolium rigidum]